MADRLGVGRARDDFRGRRRHAGYSEGVRSLLRVGCAVLAAALVIGLEIRAADLAVGAAAPAFALPGSDGAVHALADHAGKRGVVLAWFPKAFTPG
jgi:hypothetical protein